MGELAKAVAGILIDLIAAIVSAGNDEAAQEDALIDAEFKLAKARAERKFNRG